MFKIFKALGNRLLFLNVPSVSDTLFYFLPDIYIASIPGVKCVGCSTPTQYGGCVSDRVTRVFQQLIIISVFDDYKYQTEDIESQYPFCVNCHLPEFHLRIYNHSCQPLENSYAFKSFHKAILMSHTR